jgi:hypothetical protein
MAANVQPIYTRLGDVQWSSSATTANNTADLTSGTIYLVYTADTTNGGYIQKLRFKPLIATNSSATVARIWINNGDTTTVAGNNTLFDEVSLGATVISTTSSLQVYELPMNFAMAPGYRIYVTLSLIAAGGYHITAIAGKY